MKNYWKADPHENCVKKLIYVNFLNRMSALLIEEQSKVSDSDVKLKKNLAASLDSLMQTLSDTIGINHLLSALKTVLYCDK